MRQSLNVFILAQELEGEKALMNENIKHLEGLRDNMELNISVKEEGKVCILSLGKIFHQSFSLPSILAILTFHFDAYPDPACPFYADADLDPTFHFEADPDPDSCF